MVSSHDSSKKSSDSKGNSSSYGMSGFVSLKKLESTQLKIVPTSSKDWLLHTQGSSSENSTHEASSDHFSSRKPYPNQTTAYSSYKTISFKNQIDPRKETEFVHLNEEGKKQLNSTISSDISKSTEGFPSIKPDSYQEQIYNGYHLLGMEMAATKPMNYFHKIPIAVDDSYNTVMHLEKKEDAASRAYF